MATEDNNKVTRRGFVERAGAAMGWILGLPVVVGGLFAVLSPVLRILRPTLKPFNLNQPPDLPPGGDQPVCKFSDIPNPWDYKAVYYTSKNVEYTPREVNAKMIAGFAIHVAPETVADLKGKMDWSRFGKGEADARAAFDKGVWVFSRICPHLGCNFNCFPPDQTAKVRADYSFPTATMGNPYCACPCHFSCYDLKQVDDQGRYGKVVSGPAPRPPRVLTFRLDGDDIIVTGTEAGGVA